jgi:tetratricopeptide (TPR) repeat protein
MRFESFVPVVGLVVLAALGCAPGATSHHSHGGGGSEAGPGERTHDGRLAPRLQDLGTHSRRVSTRDPLAQRYFDQGLVLAYAFNHAEAVRSFREAQRIDPQLAMAWWGEAYALGPNINAPMAPSAISPAWNAIQRALSLSAEATPVERDLISAQAMRYSEHASAERSVLDRAYADAMRDLARRYRDDADVQAIAAESIMDTDPWNYWTNDGNPRPYTAEVLALIERALALDPDHPMALHLHIHAVEASQNPERAVPSAERLGRVVPGAGHLVHMPSHIFFRVGRYADAVDANLRAVEVDEDYITQCRAQGIYPAAYYPHNVHFLWIAHSYLGRSQRALDAARKTAAAAHHPMPLPPDQFHAAPLHTLVRFGRWDEILREPRPAAEQIYLSVIWHYARGMAFAARREPAEAGRELEALRALLARPEFPAQMMMANSAPLRLAKIAERLLSGEVAQARGKLDEAIAAFHSAALLEDSLLYNEPPDWPYPARHWLGAALLTAGRPLEAESVYLEDLRRRPNNGWGLFGLVEALRAQGEVRATDLAQAEARLARAWSCADVALSSSKG